MGNGFNSLMSTRVPRSVWLHWLKMTPDGNINRHRSRLCADGSTHKNNKHGPDYNQTYSPVVM